MTRPLVVVALAAALSSPVHISAGGSETALAAFGDVLALTRRAITSHWLVGRPEWKASASRWEQLAPDARGLTRCWPPVAEARESIGQAHRLFERARRQGDDAYALFEEHQRLLQEAARHLGAAERCYRAFREPG